MTKIVGRQSELRLLRSLKDRPDSSFVAVIGRRRVGKTFLIRRAFEDKFDFYLTGMSNTALPGQLANFNAAMFKYDPSIAEQAQDWFTAFQQLSAFLESSGDKAKKIVFLDELPWMDTPQSRFIPALEHFWNSWAAKRDDVILVVCGSAAAWMINKLINNRGGLHNRITHHIHLEPFTLSECEMFLQSRGAAFDRYQILQIFMVMGGIPFYLDKIDIGQSAAQNINRLCFAKKGSLRIEFDNLFRSLFKHADRHIAIVEALSKKAKGLSREQLIKETKLADGGGTTRILKELEESSFIRRYPSYGKTERHSLYQLVDFYSFFYLRFIRRNTPLDENNWINSLDNPQQRAWSGYAFEQVCLVHLQEIKVALGISGVQTNTSSWITTGSGNVNRDSAHRATPKTHTGTQIDLVIERRDGVINLCEMKFSINPFTIDKAYADALRNKIGIFKDETGTKKAIYLTLITTFGLNKNSYANSLVQNDLTMDIFFD